MSNLLGEIAKVESRETAGDTVTAKYFGVVLVIAICVCIDVVDIIV